MTAAACGTPDTEIFAGAVAEPQPTATPVSATATPVPATSLPTSSPAPPTAEPATAAQDVDEPITIPTATVEPSVDTPAATTPAVGLAVAGEMVISATYTWGPEGKIESPYVAIWVENADGELLETVALFYQQRRRGARWLDHLDRWFTGDAIRIAAGGTDVAATISSATRPPGEYTVVWDGTINGEPALAGTYSIWIESAREEGPVSLTSTTITLDGSLAPTQLPDDGELSLVSVRIDA